MLKKLKVFMTIVTMITMSLAAMPIVSNVNASSGRDCDDNAVIKCGVLSKSEFYNALNKGGSGPHQSSAELKAVFAKFGLSNLYDIDQMKEGTVTKSGQVIVNGKVVASGVKSIGRHFMPGSTQVQGVSYPLFLRNPSVSFRSNSLSAWVLMNDDGSMAMATIKSCGNIVPGVGRRIPTFTAFALKWLDENGNGVWDKSENTRIPGVTFKLTGNGVTKVAMTDSMGYARFKDLKAGTYTISEQVPAGFTPTTPATKTVKVDKDHAKAGAVFGNKKIEHLHKVKVIKFEDCNNDKVQNSGEKRLANWEFVLEGNGVNKTLKTDSNGEAVFENLKAGTYKVTEKLQEGWENTTGLTQTVTIKENDKDEFCIYFGNKKKVVEKKHQIEVIKFEDCNNNKKQDQGEKRLSGWEFKLEGNGVSRTVTTNAEGKATFDDLKAGTYKVREILKSGWENTTGIERTVVIPANSEQERFCVEFGNKKVEVKKFNIKAIKFEDKDEDKKKDNDESLLPGWQIRITGNGVDKTLTTNAKGEVDFTGLTAGTYTVSEVMQSGWKNITAISQTVVIKDKDECVEFGNKKVEVPVKKSRIKVIKFEDKNNNSKRDEDEPLLSGWEMTLKGEGVEKVQTTDANGVTVFDDLRVGAYTVTEKLQDGWVNVTALTQNAKIEKEDCEVIVMFANKKKEVPVVPQGEVTPIPVTPTSLPVTGPEAAAMGGFGTLSLLGAVGYLRRGKKLLNDNFRKIK